MTFLSTLAESTTSYMTIRGTSRELTPEETAAVGALFLVIMAFTLIAGVITYVISAIFLAKIFKKAKINGWIAWVPFYNFWKLLELGGQQGFWAVLSVIPVANYVSTVFLYIAMYHVGKKLGKDDAFVLLAIFLPIIWVIWLGIDKSKWNEKASKAPSLAK